MMQRASRRLAALVCVPLLLGVMRLSVAQDANPPKATTRPAAPPKAGVRHAPPAPTTADTPAALEFPPAVSARDVQRLRLHELAFDREDPKLRIGFTSPRGSRRVPDLVAAKLKEKGALTPEIKRTLSAGKAIEQLREVLKSTGTEFADRVEIRDDPLVFRVFRKTVLPIITDGCVRSGCHGGETARGMRLPATARDQDSVAYSTFLVLDAVTVDGHPLLNRNDPNRSILLDYLLPPGKSRPEHPPVRGATGRIPVLCPTEQHRDYIAVRDWIATLKSPRPDYGLDYKYPAWITAPRPGAPASQPATAPGVAPEPPAANK